jgi:two-component sensor histidine kinase
MMPGTLDAAALLEGLPDVSFLVDDAGTILHANRAAMQLLGESLAGKSVFSFHQGDGEHLALFLKRCLGSRQPLVGTIELSANGGGKWQCRGSVVGSGASRALLLRLGRADEAKFEALSRKFAELNEEIRQRRRTEAILRETISERELLLRELQHRVKNNMHMLSGILHGAEREARSQEAKIALADAAGRFAAVSAVQQLLYQSNNLNSISSAGFVTTLGRAAKSMAPPSAELEIEAEDLELPIELAPSLALILNELLTNAVKYGLPPDGPQKISLSLRSAGGKLVLSVQDSGPGFRPNQGQKRASGLGLVRGLLRQLGGSLAVDYRNGACCVVLIPEPIKKEQGAAN